MQQRSGRALDQDWAAVARVAPACSRCRIISYSTPVRCTRLAGSFRRLGSANIEAILRIRPAGI